MGERSRVVIEASGRTTVINEPGPPLLEREWDDVVAAITDSIVAGSFTVTGKFTDPAGTPNASTAPLAVTVQTLALAQATLVPTVGGQPLAAAPIYALPLSVALPLTLTAYPDDDQVKAYWYTSAAGS